jgi:hypothetical protein
MLDLTSVTWSEYRVRGKVLYKHPDIPRLHRPVAHLHWKQDLGTPNRKPRHSSVLCRPFNGPGNGSRKIPTDTVSSSSIE